MQEQKRNVALRHSVVFRLWMAVIVVIVALTAVLVYASVRGERLHAQSEAMTASLEERVEAARQWASLVAASVVRVQATSTSTDPALDTMAKVDLPAAIAEVGRVQKRIEAMELSATDRALLERVAEARRPVLASTARMRELKASDPAAVQRELSGNFQPALVVYMQALDAFTAQQKRNKSEVLGEIAKQRESTAAVAAAVNLLIIVLMVLGAFWIVRSIRRPLEQAMQMADRVADGDLGACSEVSQRDEFGLLLRSMDRMAGRLRQVVGDVRTGVESVSTASSEIATGNHDLSSRTEQAAANLQQTASSMEELTATVGQLAETARQTKQLANSAAQAAIRGGTVVEQVVGNMVQITESSHKISDIIGTIDSIAFQTNILALNAAVEAARAGEQGRGFAVVAAEVRTLARRSADAAKEIKALIGVSVERVEVGSRLVSQAGGAMTDIVDSVQRVTGLIGEIDSAAGEQRDGIAQINQAVGNLDQMTQQNAALVEQSAAAAHSLKEQALRLAGAVSAFRLGGGSI